MLNFCRLFVFATVLASQGLSLPVGEGALQDISSAPTLTYHSLVRRKKNKDAKKNTDNKKNTGGKDGSGGTDYASFQISDKKAGEAKENAIKVFLTPYKLKLSNDFVIGPDDALKKISKADYKKIKKMAGLASKNEEGFNKALKGKKDAALQRGKIANKVLKILGHLLYIYIDKANGKGAADLAKETKKLKTNVATDKKNKGKPMKSFLKK